MLEPLGNGLGRRNLVPRMFECSDEGRKAIGFRKRVTYVENEGEGHGCEKNAKVKREEALERGQRLALFCGEEQGPREEYERRGPGAQPGGEGRRQCTHTS